MKCPKSSFVLSCLCVGVIFSAFSATAEARIGERRNALERRVFNSGGILYRDDDVEAARKRGMPYQKYLGLLEDQNMSYEVLVYYKTDDGRKPQSKELDSKRQPDGWDLHVLFVNGKSCVEVYKRSQGMTEYEFNALLALQSNGSYWKKKEKGAAEKDGEETPDFSAFGYEMQLDSGTVRAKKIGNGLMFMDTKLDVMLAQTNEMDEQDKAPISVNGF
jgi:hypothetical protein